MTQDGTRILILWIGKANTVLREFCHSVVSKRELSHTAKLSVYKSIFVPILTYGHEPWVMTERVVSQVQSTEMGFLRRVHDVTLHDKVAAMKSVKP